MKKEKDRSTVIAAVCYESYKTWLKMNGEFGRKSFESLEMWEKAVYIDIARRALAGEQFVLLDIYEIIVGARINQGWVFGNAFKELLKEDPTVVKYAELRDYQLKGFELYLRTMNFLVG